MNENKQNELRKAEYWDAKYQNDDSDEDGGHEWYRTFEDLRPFLSRHLPLPESSANLVHLGCGTSTLTADLYRAGYKNQTSIDFSSVAIDSMKKQHSDLNELVWCVMDVRSMDFETETFDVAIDKGTLDAMLYGSLWNPEDQVREDAKAYIDEILRVLKPSGKWLYVTYRQPHFMKQFLERGGSWKIDIEVLGGEDGTFEYFGFVMTKEAIS